MPAFSDWATLPEHLAETIARSRLLDMARKGLGISRSLPESAAIDATIVEALATANNGPPVVADDAALAARFPAPVNDQLAQVKAAGFVKRYDQTAGKWLPNGLTREAGPVVSAGAKGAFADGAHDDSAFLLAMDAAVVAGGCGVLDPGVYLISNNVTLSNRVRFERGAILKPAAGVMVSLYGEIEAGWHQIFDRSLGGYVDLSLNTNTKLFKAAWWGASQAASGATNFTAINQAIDGCFGTLLTGLVPSSSTTGTATFAGKQFTPAAWVDALLEVVSGTGAGNQRKITANTGTVLTWDPTNGTGDPFRGTLALDGTSVVRINGRNALTHAERNRILNFDWGNYRVAGEIAAVCLTGFWITGSMRLSTTLTQQNANTTLLNLDACSHGRVSHITFTASANQDIQHALTSCDWTGTYQNTLKTQALLFEHCYWTGNYNVQTGDGCQIGCQIGRHGSSASNGFGLFNQGTQGDTIKFVLCNAQNFGNAAWAIGSGPLDVIPDGRAQNALGIVFDTCDIQGCYKFGVYCNGGQFFWCFGSQQNQGGNDPVYSQLNNNGADFWFDAAAGSLSEIFACRSESFRLLGGSGSSCVIRNSQTYCGNAFQWGQANIVSPTQLYRGNFQLNQGGLAANQDGRLWMAHSVTGDAKTSATTEPNFKSMPACFQRAGITMTAGSNVITGAGGGPNFSAGIHDGKACVVDRAGVGGAPLLGYFKTTDNDHGALFSDQALTAPLNASITINGVNDRARPYDAYLRIGQGGANGLLVDNHVNWIQYDFDAVQSMLPMTDICIELGQIAGNTSNGRGVPRIITGQVSRPDWFRYGRTDIANYAAVFDTGGSQQTNYNGRWNVDVGVGSFGSPRQFASTNSPFAGQPGNASVPGDYPAQAADIVFQPWIHYGMGGGAAMAPVGWDKMVGSNNGNNQYRRAVAAIGGHISCAPWPGTPSWTAVYGDSNNQSGKDLVVSASPGRGTGPGGKVIIATAPAGGVSGLGVNDVTDAAQFDADATAGNTRFLLLDITAGTMKRVKLTNAAAVAGVAGKVLYVDP